MVYVLPMSVCIPLVINERIITKEIIIVIITNIVLSNLMLILEGMMTSGYLLCVE